MSAGQRRGGEHVEAAGWSARVLPGPPLISPARSFVFPQNIAGEEDALARGALWVEVHAAGGSFLAQCALGFATAGVAHGLWIAGDRLLAVAGGYAYAIDPRMPRQTELLPLRPVADVLSMETVTVLAGYHAVLVLEPERHWLSPRLSWEGVTLTGCDGETLHGLGWDMTTDEEVSFVLNLRTRQLRGGGYRVN